MEGNIVFVGRHLSSVEYRNRNKKKKDTKDYYREPSIKRSSTY